MPASEGIGEIASRMCVTPVFGAFKCCDILQGTYERTHGALIGGVGTPT
jgi:hypothetical protein